MTCDSSNLLVECEYCGGVVQIQNEIKKSMPEIDAEQSGYDFEKGRQRAQMEMGPSNVVYSQPSQPVNQKSHTWLWVLGWICFFPIPLSILIWRSRLDNKIKLILTGGLWVFILIVCVLYKDNDSHTRRIQEVNNRITETATDEVVRETATTETPTTETPTTEAATQTSTEAAVVDKPETTETAANTRDQSDIRPEFKEMMDGYESFMDEYIAFMQNMSSDPSEMDAFTDYMDFLSKYSEWAQKIDDVDDSELTDAELNYYLEVTNRVTQKLLSAGVQ